MTKAYPRGRDRRSVSKLRIFGKVQQKCRGELRAAYKSKVKLQDLPLPDLKANGTKAFRPKLLWAAILVLPRLLTLGWEENISGCEISPASKMFGFWCNFHACTVYRTGSCQRRCPTKCWQGDNGETRPSVHLENGHRPLLHFRRARRLAKSSVESSEYMQLIATYYNIFLSIFIIYIISYLYNIIKYIQIVQSRITLPVVGHPQDEVSFHKVRILRGQQGLIFCVVLLWCVPILKTSISVEINCEEILMQGP